MPRVTFTRQLERFVTAPATEVEAGTVREALECVFASNPKLRGYVLDDQGRLRKHVNIFIGSNLIADREGLSDAIESNVEIHVMQALSGG